MNLTDLQNLAIRKQNKVLDFCAQNSNNSIVCMPAGIGAQSFAKYLKAHGIDTDYFIDNDKKKQGELIFDKKIVPLEYFMKDSKAALFIVSNPGITEQIIGQCKKNNRKKYYVVTDDYVCFSQYEIDNAFELISGRFSEYEKIYDLFNDDLSRKTFINRLKYLVSYDKHWLSGIVRPFENQYFEPDIYKVSSRDCFVDCGAYTGDTMETMLALTGGNITSYYAFEPDPSNCSVLQQKIIARAGGGGGVSVYNSGVYSEKTQLRFASGMNSASRVGVDGEMVIDCIALDTEMVDKKISFIKMDIEGSELAALQGAMNIIKNQRPVLAISVYHKFFDIIEIPRFLSSLGIDCEYYLRHYTLNASETVFYAVPRK